MTNEEQLMTCDECGCHTSEGVSVTRVKTATQTVTRCSNHHTPETKYASEEVARLPSYYDESEGAAVSASPQPRPYKNGDAQKWFEDYCYEHHINFAKRIETGGEESKRLDEIVPEILEAFLTQFFAAAPAQEPDCKDCGDSEEAIIHHLDEDDEVGHKFNPAHSAAQEQPVENSPQKGKP